MPFGVSRGLTMNTDTQARALLCSLLLSLPLVQALPPLPAQAQAQAPEVPATTPAPGQSVFSINDADPVSSVPSPALARQKPLEMGYFVMELSVRAEAAKAKGERARAAQYFRAMAKAVPDRATAFGKACEEHAAVGEWEPALEMCRLALTKEGMKAMDLARFVRVITQRPAPLSSSDVEEVDAVLARLTEVVTDNRDEQRELRELECLVAVRLENAERLLRCNAALVQMLGPNAPLTLAYASALALQQEDWLQAERVIQRARKAGLPADAVDVMQRNLAARRSAAVHSPLHAAVPRWFWLASAVAMCLCALALVVVNRRRAQTR